MAGTPTSVDLLGARAFMEALGAPILLKAVAGGGGRGIRAVHSIEDLAGAFEACQREAARSFGEDAVLAERLMRAPRHIEVQLLGDGSGAVTHLFDRDCSLQRRYQKMVEVAPAPFLPPALRAKLTAAACALGTSVRLLGAATVEFLVEDPMHDGSAFAFIEVNPRLQVEHTVTEEVTGVDIVAAMIRLVAGESLSTLGLGQADVERRGTRGHAIQLRVNLETMMPDGAVQPSDGTITAYTMPSGPGVRVDACGHVGFACSPHFDSLCAKLIVSSTGGWTAVLSKARRVLSEFVIAGVRTNLGLLQRVLALAPVVSGAFSTETIGINIAELAAAEPTGHGRLEVACATAGELRCPVAGTVVDVLAAAGEHVRKGQPLVIVSAMKMEHELCAPFAATVSAVHVRASVVLTPGSVVVTLSELSDAAGATDTEAAASTLSSAARADLLRLHDAKRHLDDASRSEAPSMVRRRKQNARTARENIADLVDAGSFVEYGSLVVAGQTMRRSIDDLQANTPRDGLVTGLATVNAGLFSEGVARVAVLAYDYTVLAGTQGMYNHMKKDRLFELAHRWRLPVLIFAEGGGGRPGDTDSFAFETGGLSISTFARWASLSGRAPMVGIANGFCFAGNAVLLGCCDVVIATRASNIGMGGPAMIEGGGLGVFAPTDIGPVSELATNGVIDIVADDEAHATTIAKLYLSYFQGRVANFEADDQSALRSAVPLNRSRVFEVRDVARCLFDRGSFLELRAAFGRSLVAALARVKGIAVGVVANDCKHNGGAIDSAAADKAAWLLRLCARFGLPVVSLCDTPGFMVGPASEAEGAVRRMCAMLIAGSEAAARVPWVTVVLRKAYGLGAQAMAAGSLHAPLGTFAWPMGEFGGMGLEGAVKLGFRKELDACSDELQRTELYKSLLAAAYERGKALNTARVFEIDDVIDPADTRQCVARVIGCSGHPAEPQWATQTSQTSQSKL